MDVQGLYYFVLHHDPANQFLKQAHVLGVLIFFWHH